MKDGEIEVLIAEDSGFMQLLIKSILSVDNKIKVIATAKNGKEAYELTKENQPDVVVMDMVMPEYDGLFGVEQIMKHCPTPIIMLSAIGHTDFNPIMHSLKLGAFDYLNKPQGSLSRLRSIDSEIVKKIRHAAGAQVQKKSLTPAYAGTSDIDVLVETLPQDFDVLVIGASTGGPRALETVLQGLPSELKIPVVIAQHMPLNFIDSFTSRLNRIIKHPVVLAEVGITLQPGTIYVAPGDKNIALSREYQKVIIVHDKQVYPEYNNPSVNSVMMSAAKAYGSKTLGIVMTGMGSDGARGMMEIHNAGGRSIAQDRETCVVFGMPQVAINSGCVDEVLPLESIKSSIINLLSN